MFKLENRLRLLLLVSALLLLGTFFFPMWKIDLWAPQYPEGLYMYIWANQFTGDVQTINILNHYVGMMPIEAGHFEELTLFPKVFASLTVLGILAALIGRAFGAIFYAIAQFGFFTWAFYDFYQWEYKFGHNLNPDAPIKMEGLYYQPPLIGTKDFLNISATSLPDTAGYMMLLSALLTGVVAFVVLQKCCFSKDRTKNKKNKSLDLSSINMSSRAS